MLRAFARGLALFIGGFAACNAVADIFCQNSYGNSWWIDVPGLPPTLQSLGLLLAGSFLLAFGVQPIMRPWRRNLSFFVTTVLLLAAAWNAYDVWRMARRSPVVLGFPLPLSALVAAAFAVVLVAFILHRTHAQTRREGVAVIALTLGTAFCFPLAQMYCFGKTDYRRTADVAVVLGARAYADGSPSQALLDRVRTGAGLYRQGLVRHLLLSGGPGDGTFHETDVMLSLAIEMGVPADAILIDREGLNTQATAENTVRIFEEQGLARALVVSHAYHLPRIKLSYQRLGWQVYTVPAREARNLRGMPYFMAREVAALWVYWLHFKNA